MVVFAQPHRYLDGVKCASSGSLDGRLTLGGYQPADVTGIKDGPGRDQPDQQKRTVVKQTTLLVTFDEVIAQPEPSERLVGRKAASLIALRQQGFPVPTGACVTTQAFDEFLERNDLTALVHEFHRAVRNGPARFQQAAALRVAIRAGSIAPALAEAISRFLAENPDARFAVRSSGTCEDGRDASFAGLYDSTLNLQGIDEISEAIKACWSSVYSDRAIRYLIDRGMELGSPSMAVLIQVMVDADKSGVAFSVNPMGGSDTEVLIEASAGLGEHVVGGTVTPDCYRYDWYRECATGQEIRGASPVLEEDEVRRITEVAVRTQAQLGSPVDIEWAIRQSQLYLLQSRPITTLSIGRISGEWTTADFRDGGVSSDVCTPFMWSLYDLVWERTLPAYLRRVGLLARDTSTTWGRMFFARPYWNVGVVKDALKRLPGFVERDFDEDLGINVTYEGSGYQSRTNLRTILRGLNVLFRLRRSFKCRLSYCDRFVPLQRRRLIELDALDVTKWSDDRLFTFYRDFIEQEYYRSESAYFNLIYDTSNATTLFHQQLEKLGTDVPFADLIGGLTNLSHLRESRSLVALVRRIRANEQWVLYWVDAPVAATAADWRNGQSDNGMDLVRAHIEAFKHRSTRELDLQFPRNGDDPTPIFNSIKQLLASDAPLNPDEQAQRRRRIADRAREALLRTLPRYRRRQFERRLMQLRKFLWMREELRDLSSHYYYHVRRFTLEIERRLIRRGVLRRERDVFFLPIREILAVIDGTTPSTALVEAVARNRRYYDGFRNFDNPNEIGRRYRHAAPTVNDAPCICGLGCSPGVVEGLVKVIRDVFDAERLQQGDILVTEFTDPGWTVKFSMLRAVVTETGGMLSHAAVIAREYGIPAVLAVPHATDRLRDGQLVRVDGSAGTVTVVDDERSAATAANTGNIRSWQLAEQVA